MPTRIAQRQQQTFKALTNGITESKPSKTPPISAGLTLLFIALLLTRELGIVNKIADICAASTGKFRPDRRAAV